MKINFAKGAWNPDDLKYVYSRRFPRDTKFIQNEDCIENPKDPTMRDGYSYITLFSPEKYTANVRIKTRCSFEGLAAPLIVLAKEFVEENGILCYGDYQEAVLWTNGLNVWDLWTEEDGTMKWHKVLGIDSSVSQGEIHELEVEVREGILVVRVDHQTVTLRMPALYSEFYLGITGCEGVCRFYDLEIEQDLGEQKQNISANE